MSNWVMPTHPGGVNRELSKHVLEETPTGDGASSPLSSSSSCLASPFKSRSEGLFHSGVGGHVILSGIS